MPYREAAQPLPDSEDTLRDDDERGSIPPVVGKAIPRDAPIEAVGLGALVGLGVCLVALILGIIILAL